MCSRYLVALVVIVAPMLGVLCQECSKDTMRRCKKVVDDELSSNGRYDRNDVNDQCRTLRENFDCLLWQTSMCLDKSGQESNRDAILRSWRYLASFCESQGNWYTKQCFQKEEVKRCEALLPSRGYSTDTTSCRSYSSFRECVTTIVQNQCSVSDQRLLGTYLMEKGQQRAWNCPRNYDSLTRTNPASAPLAADVEPRYTSLPETSYGYCSDESRYDLQSCREKFYSSQKEGQTYNDNDMRNHKTCCAMVHYEDCVKTTLDDKCGERGRTEARNIVSDMKSRYPYYNCNDHTMNECNGAALLTTTFFINTMVTLASIFVYFRN